MTENGRGKAPPSTSRNLMKIITSKYMVIILTLITLTLCFFPIQGGRLTDGEACTMVIRGFNFMEFTPLGITVLIAPLLVPIILYGCQSKGLKELELTLLIGNCASFINGINITRDWLLEMDASMYGMIKPTMLLYPIAFVLLCGVAIVKNIYDDRIYNGVTCTAIKERHKTRRATSRKALKKHYVARKSV